MYIIVRIIYFNLLSITSIDLNIGESLRVSCLDILNQWQMKGYYSCAFFLYSSYASIISDWWFFLSITGRMRSLHMRMPTCAHILTKFTSLLWKRNRCYVSKWLIIETIVLYHCINSRQEQILIFNLPGTITIIMVLLF